MAPKWSFRPRWSAVRSLQVVAVSLSLLGASHGARADGAAVPTIDANAPQASVGVPTRAALAVSGGVAPYQFEVVDGKLPAGLSLARDGKITGTPLESGSTRFTVRVTDSGRVPGSVVQTYVMYVQDRSDPTLDANTTGMLNQQAATARNFAFTQIGNYQTRLEALRSDSAGRCIGDAPRPSLAAPTPAQKPSGLMEQPPQALDSLAMPLDNCRTLRDRATTLWTAGALNVGSNHGQSGAAAFRFASQGITLGGDFGLRPNLAFGAGVGIARDESQILPAGGTASGAYGASLGGYLSYRPLDRLYLEAVFGVGDAAIESSRATANGTAVGTRPTDQRFISVSAGQRIATSDWQVVPYTRIDHVRATLRTLNESGAATDALSFSEERVPSLKVAAGASATTSLSTPIGVLLPRTSLEYRRELERSEAGLLRYTDDPSGANYSIVPSAAERDSTMLGIGANLILVNRWNFGLSSTINRSSAVSSTRIDATVSRMF